MAKCDKQKSPSAGGRNDPSVVMGMLNDRSMERTA
jgi:hypothetical protein